MKFHKNRIDELKKNLRRFSKEDTKLLGLESVESELVLCKQIIDSLRRVEFVRQISMREVSASRINPNLTEFDPLRAAIYFRNKGDLNEAFWLTFLATHCGKHEIYGWRLASALYGGFSVPSKWTWVEVSADPDSFIRWLDENRQMFLTRDNHYHFSNHRKYESLDVQRRFHTGLIVKSYVDWISNFGDHSKLLRNMHDKVGQHPEVLFDQLYTEVSNNVLRFGRLGTFDFLCMLGKLNLAPIEPGSTYIKTATGPKQGAMFLIEGNRNGCKQVKELEDTLKRLAQQLEIGMQELEDALCNWQKQPTSYFRFKG